MKKGVKKKRAVQGGEERAAREGVADALRATEDSPTLRMDTAARSATATAETEASGETGDGQRPPLEQKRKRTRSEAMQAHWREVRAGRRPHPDTVMSPRRKARLVPNPLFALPERERSELFVWLRECPYEDAVKHMLRGKKIPKVSNAQLNEFFQQEAVNHWSLRMERAATEADALVRLAQDSVPKFSAGILAALGQEAFRQVTSGGVDPDSMAKLAKLFMQARGDERMDQMQELKREKLAHELQDQVEHALEKLAEEVDRHPAAKEAFDAMRRELAANREADA